MSRELNAHQLLLFSEAACNMHYSMFSMTLYPGGIGIDESASLFSLAPQG